MEKSDHDSILQDIILRKELEIEHLKTENEQLKRSRDYFQREEAAVRVRLSEYMAPYDQACADFVSRACEMLGKTGLTFAQVMYEIEQLTKQKV